MNFGSFLGRNNPQQAPALETNMVAQPLFTETQLHTLEVVRAFRFTNPGKELPSELTHTMTDNGLDENSYRFFIDKNHKGSSYNQSVH